MRVAVWREYLTEPTDLGRETQTAHSSSPAPSLTSHPAHLLTKPNWKLQCKEPQDRPSVAHGRAEKGQIEETQHSREGSITVLTVALKCTTGGPGEEGLLGAGVCRWDHLLRRGSLRCPHGGTSLCRGFYAHKAYSHVSTPSPLAPSK